MMSAWARKLTNGTLAFALLKTCTGCAAGPLAAVSVADAQRAELTPALTAEPAPAPDPKQAAPTADPAPATLPAPRTLPPDAVPEQAARSCEAPLLLPEVLASVEANFPLLLAALQEQGITSGQLLAAQGAFDLNLRGREFWQAGTFESNRAILGVDQNLAWNGLSYFAGYRHSVGDFPIYYGDRKTGDGGEFRAGLLIPLLANRAIDRRRATLQQAAITRALADPAIAAQRLDFVRAAARAYWTWVAAGRRYQVAQAVLRLAEERDKQLAELVGRGAVAEIERIDNQRVIVERQARLIAAERVWQQTSIALSLYFRAADGAPVVPTAARLPAHIIEPQPFDRARLERDVTLALDRRPELLRLALQKQRAAVDLDFANNQALPSLNFGLEGYQDLGPGSSFSKTPLVTGTQLDRTAFIASLQLDLPLQRREARGRALSAQSTLAQLSFQEQFQRDRIGIELQDAASALERSYELLGKARENIKVARQVERGERERFLKGQGTIVILNLRELVAAEASFAEIDALAEYYRALADYQAALGLDPSRDPAASPFCPPATDH
ncbi:MAG: TolC family protein [Planctomycetia bacterium]|nr:TolC family protein [Planctomycetia bacterium]